MPFAGSKYSTYRERESGAEGAVFDNGSHPLIASLFSLLIATCVVVVWLNADLDLRGTRKVLAGVGVLAMAILGILVFIQGTTRVELRTDRIKGRVTLRRKRIIGRWSEQWSVGAGEVRAVVLQKSSVTLEMVNGQSLSVDSGTDSDALRKLADQLSKALGKRLESRS